METQQHPAFHLPPCGLFLGSGVYPTCKDYLLGTLYAHQTWMPQSFSPAEMIEKIVADNQGNLAQYWSGGRGYAPHTIGKWVYALDEIGIEIPEPDWEKGTDIKVSESPQIQQHQDRFGAGALRFIREAAKQDIYTMFLYVRAHPQWARQFQNHGKHYLGYDFGERFTFRLNEASMAGKKLEDVTLRVLADDLMERVREHVDERRAGGWGPIYGTSVNFYIDYEIAAGTDVPLVEDFAFSHLNFASALSRGLYRQFRLPTWGSHMAHEHYSWIHNASEHKWHLLRAAMYLKYMSGCKIIINESGNWFVEASLCEDSPKHEFPPVPLAPSEVNGSGNGNIKFAPYIEEAREFFPLINYDAPVVRRYRKEISDFYDFVKEHGTPEGQPESTLALAKGNLDLCTHRFSPNSAIAGAYTLADRNPAWFENTPERGWNIVRQVFYPRPNVIEPYENAFLSGTPYGQVDIVSFVADRVEASFLNAHYKALLFSGWNTCSPRQYEVLTEYVANGGTLFLGIPHLSTNATRNFGDYGAGELVHGGDFSALCGVHVKGRGKRIYWATAPRGNEELGFRFPRRFGILSVSMGDIEITGPAVETLAVDDEQGSPLVLRHNLGKGQVYFLNSWAYPGAFDQDFGPGSTQNSPGLVGYIYHHIAQKFRGHVWISGDGGEAPDAECDYINFSYFPAARKICLYNIDPVRSHRATLHVGDSKRHFELGPGEFRFQESATRAG